MSVKWTVHTQTSDVELDGQELLMQLLQKSMQSQRLPHEELVRVLTEYLQTQGALAQCTPQQLALIALDVGYFYRVFLDKNKVTTEITDAKQRNETTGDLSTRSSD